MATRQIIVGEENLQEPEISWTLWIAVFLSGFFVGAVLDIFSLYLFAHWFAIH
jgi:hypothetical protein